MEVKITITCRECGVELNEDFAGTYTDANGTVMVDFTNVPVMQIDHHCQHDMERHVTHEPMLLQALREEEEKKKG